MPFTVNNTTLTPQSLSPIALTLRSCYPSYQLYATAGAPSLEGEQLKAVFKRCVLHTFSWLRYRFVNYDMDQLRFPEAADADRVKLDDFKSFSLSEPYSLEVVSLPEDGVWAMRLTEPDKGNEPNAYSPGREPVSGRTFETNIAFTITEKGVECGVRTMVMEPSDVDTDAEVFRPAVVKGIARDPEVGLWHGYKLSDEPYVAADPESVRKLVKWINSDERQISVIVIDRAEEAPVQVPEILPDISAAQYVKSGLADIGTVSRSIMERALAQLEPKDRGINIIDLARFRMAYVQYFEVSADMSPLFLSELGDGSRPGVVSVFEPVSFGRKRWTFSSIDKVATESKLDDYAHNAPGRKNMTFGGVRFVPAAKELQQHHIAELADSKEAVVRAYEDRIKALAQAFTEDKQALNASILAEQREQLRLKREFEQEKKDLLDRMARMQADFSAELERVNKAGESDRKVVERIEVRKRRPQSTDGIAQWVEDEFSGKMLFHERAKDLIDALNPGEFDAGLLCDCLEFLACEYRDYRLGLIDPDRMNMICSEKYGRGFEVTPTGYTTAPQTPSDYKIKYYIGFTGKPTETPLDLHLKIGNTSQDLIRIYFLFDANKQLVVVGSLPKHLPTKSYR